MKAFLYRVCAIFFSHFVLYPDYRISFFIPLAFRFADYMYQKMRLRGTELLKKAFEVNNGHGIIQESVANNPKGNGNWGERIFNDGNLNDENFLKKNLLLPVPKDEIDTNSALDYSDNNYGYTN